MLKNKWLKLSQSDDVRAKNLATIFLEDYFSSKIDKNESENDENSRQDRKRKGNEIDHWKMKIFIEILGEL